MFILYEKFKSHFIMTHTMTRTIITITFLAITQDVTYATAPLITSTGELAGDYGLIDSTANYETASITI